MAVLIPRLLHDDDVDCMMGYIHPGMDSWMDEADGMGAADGRMDGWMGGWPD
jgi:hypothetical protein